MSVPAQATPRNKKFGCAYIAFPIVLVIFGLTFVWAGGQLAPGSNAAAQVFRSDPSCTADLTAHVSPGACRTVAATVLVAEMKVSGNGKTRVHTPLVHLRFADGTFHDAQLDGDTGEVFVYSVPSGAPAVAQLFRGELVRVTSDNTTAETIDAPDVDAENVGEMPWVGAVAIAVALLIFIARLYVVRTGR